MNVREYIQKEADKHHEAMSELTELLYNIPPQLDGRGVGELESDSIHIYGSWLVLRDTSHKELGAQLASITDQSVDFKPCGSVRTAVFRNVGPFYKVDLDRPSPKCRRVKVRKPAEEIIIDICGDLPTGWELLEELDVPA